MQCVYYPSQRNDMKQWIEKQVVVYGILVGPTMVATLSEVL